MKCFHAGGHAKWWIVDALSKGLFGEGADIFDSHELTPYRELTERSYLSEQRIKNAAARLDFMKIMSR